MNRGREELGHFRQGAATVCSLLPVSLACTQRITTEQQLLGSGAN